jgi:hypothetical protein
MRDWFRIQGCGFWVLITRSGLVVGHGEFDNLITQVGEQVYMERGSGIATTPATPAGMRLGTCDDRPAKTGAGAHIGSYIQGSAVPLDAGYPSSSLVGTKRRVSYAATWPEGVATASGIIEVVLTNEMPLTNVAGVEANTLARALLRPGITKPADRQLRITWYHESAYRDSPNKVTSRCIVDSLRHKDFIYGVVVTPFGEVL